MNFVLTNQEQLEAIALYETGLTVEKVAEKMNCSSSSISNYFKSHNFNTRRQIDRKNLGPTAISKKLNIGRNAVVGVISRYKRKK